MDVRQQLEQCDLRKLRLYLHAKTQNWEDAEDLAQEALILAWKHLDQFRGDCKVSTWLTTIATNCFLMSRRRRRAHQRVDYATEQAVFWGLADPHDMEAEVISHVDSPKIGKVLNGLPPGYRQVITMRARGMRFKEIATILDVSVGTVKSQANRGRKKLAQKLEECGYAR